MGLWQVASAEREGEAMSDAQWRVDALGVFLCPECQGDEEREHWLPIEPDEDMPCEIDRRHSAAASAPVPRTAVRRCPARTPLP